MKNLKIASLVIALPLFIGQLSFAQDSSSDINIAIDGSREILEKQLDVPLSVPSAYQMGFERATGVPASIPSAVSNFIENVGGAAGLSEATIDAITGPVGAFLAASGESSTAGPDLGVSLTSTLTSTHGGERLIDDKLAGSNLKLRGYGHEVERGGYLSHGKK